MESGLQTRILLEVLHYTAFLHQGPNFCKLYGSTLKLKFFLFVAWSIYWHHSLFKATYWELFMKSPQFFFLKNAITRKLKLIHKNKKQENKSDLCDSKVWVKISLQRHFIILKMPIRELGGFLSFFFFFQPSLQFVYTV